MARNLTSKNKPVRIGVVGAGRWGRNIIRTVLSVPDVELAGVASRNLETRQLVPDRCPVVTDWREFVTQIPMEGIVIATPPATHLTIAEASIRLGLHTLVEKPLSLRLDEAERILLLARQYRRVVWTEFTQLFNPKFRALLAALPMLEGMQSILTRAGNFGPIRNDAPVLWDWGAHELSMLITLAGHPLTIEAKCIEQRQGEQGDESLWKLECTFRSGVSSETTMGNMMPRCRKVAVFGVSGALVFDDLAQTPLSSFLSSR
jgi:predicted dehydrogenase